MKQHILITGGSLNIGWAIARRARLDGYHPIILDQTPPEDRDIGEYHEVDLSDADATRAVLAEILRKRAITRLVNNVGVVKPASLEELSLDDFDTVMALNVRNAAQCAQALMPGMRDAGFGRIVNIASRTALGKELRTFYGGSKAALISMAKTWALELAGFGITANAVAPGTIETTAFYRNNPPDAPKTRAIIDAIPAGRIGTPDDIANAVSFFLDERSGFVTGQALYVCGGLTVGRA